MLLSQVSSLSARSLIWQAECDIPVPGIPGTKDFAPFWMVLAPVLEKIGPGKKYRYRKIWSRKKVPVLVPENLVPEKVPVLVLEQICPGTGEFPGTPGLDGIGTHTGKNRSRKKVPVPVPEKIGPGKSTSTGKNWSRKSTGTGIGKNWPRKKVLVPVPEKILGTVTAFKSQSRGPFYV